MRETGAGEPARLRLRRHDPSEAKLERCQFGHRRVPGKWLC
jgi:hypothetical protein